MAAQRPNGSTWITLIDREIRDLDRKKRDLHVPMGFVAQREGDAYLVFRGTHTLGEWIYDFNVRLKPYPYSQNFGNVHQGFLGVYQRCRDSFIESLRDVNPEFDLYITGHSLGAGLSLLSLPDVMNATPFKQPTLYNIGCPRTGDKDFATAYNALPDQKTFRIANTADLLTVAPLPTPIPIPIPILIWIPITLGGYYTHVDVPVDFTNQTESIEGNHSPDTYLAVLNG